MDGFSSLQDSLPLNDDNLETFSLIWLDSTIDEATNRDTNVKLRSLLHSFKAFKHLHDGQNYIEQRSKDDRLILIVSGRFGREIVDKIHPLRQISSIYVFCMDKEANKQWASKFPKIRAVTITCAELLASIEADHKIQMKIDLPFSIQIFNQTTPFNTISKKTNYQLIYFQLFLNYLCKIKSTEQETNDLITLLKDEYKASEAQLESLDKFHQTYASNQVLSWYTPQSLFHRILSKALSIQNIPMIIHFSALISDLYSQLKHDQPRSLTSAFRSQLLSMTELDCLKENLGQLISINSFWYANIDLAKALADVNQFKTSGDLQRVLFAIGADPLLTTSKPFALIKAQDESDNSSDALYMAGSVFRLVDITQQDDQMWVVNLILCTDEEYNSILNLRPIAAHDETDDGNLRIFAKILWKLGQLDLSHLYYNRLISQLPSNDPLLKIVYEDFATIALERKEYDSAVEWYRKTNAIKDQNPSVTFIDCFPDTAVTMNRPTCQKQDRCEHLKDEAHTRVYFHILPCRYGSLCRMIDDAGHAYAFTHPDFCDEGGLCTDMSESHLFKYRHVPLCEKGLGCTLYLKRDGVHCRATRHCKPNCQLGSYCFNFHNIEHIESENHFFKPPCPYTPYMCHFYDYLSENLDQITSPHCISCRFHVQKYSHVCPRGRHCTELSNREHTQYHIHVIRFECPNKDDCQLLHDEDHLNSYSHPLINDIRSLCLQPRKECPDRLNLEHIKRFRHTGRLDHFGVSRCLALNRNIDFVRNHSEMLESVKTYIQASNWTPSTLTIPDELKRWIRALRPVHRCSKVIFESILIHGHAMSRDHMNSLREARSVAKAIKHHAEVKHILGRITNQLVQRAADKFIRILVEKEFKAANPDTQMATSEAQCQLPEVESILTEYTLPEDRDTIRKWTHEISEASIQLHSNQTGIGFPADQAFGTNKHVFAVLGPHRGHYYGDIFLVFSRELMLHPDSNFSIQAATTFGQSQRAYKLRPWLKDPGTPEARVEHFHQNKLHSSIDGYEEAAAAELLALTGLAAKSTTNVDLNAIKNRWLTTDSHFVFESHLPQLIPLDYIERVFIAQSTFDSLSSIAQELSRKIFGSALCITPHQIDASIKLASPTQPLDPARTVYQSFVVNDVLQMIETDLNNKVIKQGTWVTIPASSFQEDIVNPLTISQSFQQDQSTSNSIYIYWEVFNGDMMLTLTNQIIDRSVTDQPHLQCLTCYIAKWPSNNIPKITTQTIQDYREGSTYISNHHPKRHYIIMEDRNFKATSETFHRGCNVDDYIMYCLHIDRTSSIVTLSICRSNSIQNQQKIAYQFKSTELDLNQLEFIQMSAGFETVPVRNLIIRHEPVKEFHPMIDSEFIDGQTSLFCLAEKLKTNSKKTEPQQEKTMNLCPDSVHCLIQYRDTPEAKEHIKQYTHPCRFSEKCRRKHYEPHLVHIPHLVPNCAQDKDCPQLEDPLHRAQFRHSELPDYLVPCRSKQNCTITTKEHKIKYSHRETVPLPSLE